MSTGKTRFKQHTCLSSKTLGYYKYMNHLKILFLNENPIPSRFNSQTVSGKELRLRSAISQVEQIHVFTFPGMSVGTTDGIIGELESKIHVHILPNFPYYLRMIPLFICGLLWTIKHKPKLIEAESPIISGWSAMLIGKLTQTPRIVEVRSTYHDLAKHKLKWLPYSLKNLLINFSYQVVFTNVSGVIANSKFYQRLVRQYNVNAHEINPGLQNMNLSDNNHKPHTITNHQTFTIGFIGRLVKEKNVELLIEALELLLTKSIVVKLEIAGDGPNYHHLKNYVSKKQLQDHITFLGMSEPSQVIPRWDVMVNPINVIVPLEMVNVESAYFGVPVICFGNDQYPETVIDQVTGWKINGNLTAHNLAAQIEYAINHPKIRRKYSKQAHDFAIQNYQFQNQVQKLTQLYQELGLI